MAIGSFRGWPTSSEHLAPLLGQLSLEEKVALVQGTDAWHTAAIPTIGLRAMTLSDGPSGVRGPRWDERDPSISLPSGSVLAASWDVELAYRYGAVIASEARRKGVDIVLGPMINLHRSPLGGRNFECLGEDPTLTGRLAAAYVRGLQDQGVAATPKHYVANDSETERFTADVHVDERSLRELYLAPFEHAVAAGAWAVMSAYNSVNGVTMTESPLLGTPLKTEWGFEGVVISDWTAVRSLEAARAAQDLAMPGPAEAWSDLAAAVREGQVAEADLDQKVMRVLLLAERVGALGDREPPTPRAVDGVALARQAAVEGTVLLHNNGVLPLDTRSVSTIVVIGQNAIRARIQGGGSATVLPTHVVSPLAGIRAAFPNAAVRAELGVIIDGGIAELDPDRILNPVSGGPGLRVTFLDAAGVERFAEDRFSTSLVWFGGDAPVASSERLILHTSYTPTATGSALLGLASAHSGRLFVDGTLVLETPSLPGESDVDAAFLNPPATTARVEVLAGQPVDLRADFTISPNGHARLGMLSAHLGISLEGHEATHLLERAAAAAAASDIAVVVVGTNAVVESEGYDREDLALPGRQNDLVRAVAAENARTIVVVNSGAHVELPWVDDVAAVLHGSFGGQEFGSAIGDIITGSAEPGGRLAAAWPSTLRDTPVAAVSPAGGVLSYAEGIHIGQRAWAHCGAHPAFPFGFGLGYTSWSFHAIRRVDDIVEVELTNVGGRPGKQVAQLYAERSDSVVDRPVRWLVGFAVVRASPGETVTARIAIPERALEHWNQGWEIEPGSFTFRAGAHFEDLPLTLDWHVVGRGSYGPLRPTV